MQLVFEKVIENYILNNIAVINDFISPDLRCTLIENINNLKTTEQLILARTGQNESTLENTAIRSDKIFWLDKKHNNLTENAFLKIIEDFILYLNSTCFTGITDYEFHYALYEPGSFYKKHFDQFKENSSRQFTMIFYLNENWQVNDGGELCYYQNKIGHLVSPLSGTCVFFKSSEIEHEVLKSNKNRLSITGWLKK